MYIHMMYHGTLLAGQSAHIGSPQCQVIAFSSSHATDIQKHVRITCKVTAGSWVYWKAITGWWFGTCFFFPYIGNDHPNWLSDCSEGFPNHQPEYMVIYHIYSIIHPYMIGMIYHMNPIILEWHLFLFITISYQGVMIRYSCNTYITISYRINIYIYIIFQYGFYYDKKKI